MRQQDRYWQARKVTLIGAAVNFLLGCIKLIGGYFFYSHALIADGVHSFSDLLSDAMILFASKFGSQDADLSHPYGHQRIETAAILVVALLLILAGLGIIWDAFDELIHIMEQTPKWLALPIAILSIIANEILFHYTKLVGLRIQSPLVEANAWHHRSDAASSIVVALGLLGSLFGLAYLDLIAAIIVGLMVIKMGLNYGWGSVKELVDTAVETNLQTQIAQTIQSIDGVLKIHQLRTRLMGGDIFIDVHVLVASYISVSEGHYIAQQVHRVLMQQFHRVKDVTVHIDPEDDEINPPSLDLANRDSLQKQLLISLKKDYPALQFCNLHYLNGEITIDLVFDGEFNQWEALKQRITSEFKTQKDIKKIRLFSLNETIDGS